MPTTLSVHRPNKPPRTVQTTPGTTLYEALTRAHIPVPTRCRGSTICGLCRVHVDPDAASWSDVLPDEASLLDRFGGRTPTVRLACRAVVPDDAETLTVRIEAEPDGPTSQRRGPE